MSEMDQSQNSEPIVGWKLAAGKKQAQRLTLEPVSADINEVCRRFPGGAYTTLRTYQGNRVLRPEQHLQRLEQSAAMVGKPVTIDREALRAALRIAVRQKQSTKTRLAEAVTTPVIFDDYRLRLVLDLEQTPGDLYIIRGKLITPTLDDYLQGVKVIVSDLHRVLPEAKLTRFLEKAGKQPLPPDINEAVMVDEDGCLLEGLSSNFYAVINAEIWTAGEGVLPGTTRSLVLDEVIRMEIPLHLEAPRMADIPVMSEAFLTSTSRGVLPVVWINSQVVGNGQPGAITRQLGEGFWKTVLSELEGI